LDPRKKRHFPPLFDPFLLIFSLFFSGIFHPGANWREKEPQKRWAILADRMSVSQFATLEERMAQVEEQLRERE